ncbi:hypothetical protein GCM10025734_53120 [Kitasatospora paranensis]
MVFQMPDRPEPGFRARVGPPSRRSKVLLLTAGVLVALFLLFVMVSGVWTDWLWFRSVHYSGVYTTQLKAKAGLFAVFGLAMAVVVGLNLWLAYRLRPPLAAMSVEQQSLDRYRMGWPPTRSGCWPASRCWSAWWPGRRPPRSGEPGCCG